MRIFSFVLTAVLAVACKGGYSFTGGDVGNAKTLSVEAFGNRADLINPMLAQRFTTELQSVMVRQTPLSLLGREGDLQFSGAIVEYSVRSEAPAANDQVAQSRLSISVEVVFVNTLDDKKSFTQRFSAFRNFPASADLRSVEDGLVEEMVSELSDKIFNRALVQW
ncbi:MAG: LPS assembly lipoprotein LptE [Schleiferiaceae bacterium]